MPFADPERRREYGREYTPGGSEFTTPAECAAYVRYLRDKQHSLICRKTREVKEAEAKVAALAGAVVEKWQYQTHCLVCGISGNHDRLKHADTCPINNLPASAERYLKVMEAAKAYRDEEREDTPRMFRGKKLHDLGLALDEALTTKTENAG